MMKRAVIFDMDGLMFDTEAVGCAAWKLTAKEFGFEMTDELFCQMIGHDPRESRKILESVYGPDFDYVAARKRRIEIGNSIELGGGLRPKPGLFDLLDKLDELKIKKAVASGTEAERVGRRLRQAGIEDRFNVIVTGDEVPRGKPFPDIFLLASQRLEVPPQECLILEDAESGIRAARDAGIDVVLVPDIHRWAPEVEDLARCVVPSLFEVRERLEEILS